MTRTRDVMMPTLIPIIKGLTIYPKALGLFDTYCKYSIWINL